MASPRKRSIVEVGTSVPASINPEKKDNMNIATVEINLGHCSVIKDEITPAELLLLKTEHNKNAKGAVVVNLTETGSVTRTDKDEMGRLASKYGMRKVKALFPGYKPRLPETFAEVQEAEVEQIQLPGGVLAQSGSLPDNKPLTAEILKGTTSETE